MLYVGLYAAAFRRAPVAVKFEKHFEKTRVKRIQEKPEKRENGHGKKRETKKRGACGRPPPLEVPLKLLAA